MKKHLMLLFFFLLTARIGYAHPHTFITTCLEAEFSGEKIKGVWVNWEFDEMFSAEVILDTDTNKDGKFGPKETELVYENAFSNLEHYGYFFYMRKGSKRTLAKKVESFSAKQNGQKLVYKFFIPIETADQELIISIFDPTFFCAVNYVEQRPVSFLAAENVLPTYQIVKNNKFPVYYNPAGAIDDQAVYTEFKPGLMTAYPEEVIINFKRR